MKKLASLFLLTLVTLFWSCSADQKTKNVSDSALTAPVDTLGSDTSRQNSIGDSANKVDVDTAR